MIHFQPHASPVDPTKDIHPPKSWVCWGPSLIKYLWLPNDSHESWDQRSPRDLFSGLYICPLEFPRGAWNSVCFKPNHTFCCKDSPTPYPLSPAAFNRRIQVLAGHRTALPIFQVARSGPMTKVYPKGCRNLVAHDLTGKRHAVRPFVWGWVHLTMRYLGPCRWQNKVEEACVPTLCSCHISCKLLTHQHLYGKQTSFSFI